MRTNPPVERKSQQEPTVTSEKGELMTQTYMTPKELSDRYKGRISERTLANWRSTRTGPSFTKIGGRVLYPLSEILSWESTRVKAERSQA